MMGEFGPDEAPREDAMPPEPEDCNCWSDGKPDPECKACGGRGSSKPTLGSRQPSKRLCPAFVEWLMGWPVGWSLPCAGALTTFGSSETESSGSPLHRPSLNSGGR